MLPFCFVLGEDLSLGVIPDDLHIDKTSKVKLFGPEERHSDDDAGSLIGDGRLDAVAVSDPSYHNH